MSKVILFTGMSAAGKTTVSQEINKVLKFPLFSKDLFKETIFDQLGWKDVDWSTQVGALSIELLFKVLESHALTNTDVMLEANFRYSRDRGKLAELQEKYKFTIIEIYCTATAEELFERYKKRVESGNRHPGHCDKLNFKEMQKQYANNTTYVPLDLGPVITLDTTSWDTIDYEKLIKEVKKL